MQHRKLSPIMLTTSVLQLTNFCQDDYFDGDENDADDDGGDDGAM